MNVLDRFLEGVRMHPDRIAIVDRHGEATTYAALEERSAHLAAAWRRSGIVRGDRVLIALKVDAGLYAALAALWRIGAVAVFPEPALGRSGLGHAVRATAPRAFVSNGVYRLLPWISRAIGSIPIRLAMTADASREDEVAVMATEDPALVSFTSGSTGVPKAISRSHGFLVSQDRAVAPLLSSESPQTDLVVFPVFVIAALGRGDASVLPDWPLGKPELADPRKVAERCRRHGVTRMLLSPAVAHKLSAIPLPDGVRTVFVGGGPVFPDLTRRLHAASSGLQVVTVYGSTEAEPIAHCLSTGLEHVDPYAGLLAGAISPGTRVRVIDHEIVVTGDHVVQGYLDPSRDASTKIRDEDGTIWHRTGDAGRLDDAGRLWLLGRLDDRIGDLWPFPVEMQARTWPGVSKAALVDLEGTAVLFVQGDRSHIGEWRRRFLDMGGDRVIAIRRMPVDRRHGSKIDVASLRASLS